MAIREVVRAVLLASSAVWYLTAGVLATEPPQQRDGPAQELAAGSASDPVALSLPKLRVATYNICWGNMDLDRIGDAIAQSEADIVLLQETTPRSEQYLSQRFRRTYRYVHFVGYRGAYAAERFGYLSKHRLTSLKFHPPVGKGLFGSYHARCRWQQQDIQLVNVHLMPLVIRRGARLTDVLGTYSQTEQVHAQEIERIVRQLEKDKPTVVAGDFNSLSAFVAPRRLKDLRFIDSLDSVTKDGDGAVTWQWPTRPLPLRLRIDYIFHSPHFQTNSARVVEVTGSDHHLVVSELALAAAR